MDEPPEKTMDDWPETDFHIHATRYRTRRGREEMGVAEIVHRCEQVGLTHVGIGEHQNLNPKHPVDCLRELAAELRTVSSPSLRIYLGTEVDIVDDRGGITADPGLSEELRIDYHLAALHDLSGLPRDSLPKHIAGIHRRLLTATRHAPLIDIIAHPWTSRRLATPPGNRERWPFGEIPRHLLAEWIEALAKHRVAVEVSPKCLCDFSDPNYLEFLVMLRQAEVRVAVGSDAHSLEVLGETMKITRFLRALGFNPGDLWMPRERSG